MWGRSRRDWSSWEDGQALSIKGWDQAWDTSERLIPDREVLIRLRNRYVYMRRKQGTACTRPLITGCKKASAEKATVAAARLGVRSLSAKPRRRTLRQLIAGVREKPAVRFQHYSQKIFVASAGATTAQLWSMFQTRWHRVGHVMGIATEVPPSVISFPPG